ncbi:MAG: nicotinate-nucleotide adenylyltransferase [Deltaproteobacteria bacterium]|nr:nicotinate-nucleotide adenylyltransferase [Deltaproteobacteria bacterium]
MKWGLFGGTFDPIHMGHLRCAVEVREIFDLDRIIFIPAAQQPLKTDKKVTPFHHREQMVKLAVEANPPFSVSDIENLRGGKSYSIDTVKHFLTASPEGLELYFIMGQDAFQDIHRWKEWEQLLLLCNFIVVTRPGYEVRKFSDILPEYAAAQFHFDTDAGAFTGPTGGAIYFKRLTFLEISSTDIRNRTKNGQSILYLVPDSVRHYISENALYKDL